MDYRILPPVGMTKNSEFRNRQKSILTDPTSHENFENQVDSTSTSDSPFRIPLPVMHIVVYRRQSTICNQANFITWHQSTKWLKRAQK
jgi:hypothetical protein